MVNRKTSLPPISSQRDFGHLKSGTERILDLSSYFSSLVRSGVINATSAAGYDIVADVYDNSPWAKFWDRNELPIIEKAISKIGKISSALDIGCGTGRYSALLSKFARSVTGVDISEQMLRIARGKVHSVQFIRDDVRAFLDHAPQYSLITCARVLSQIPDAAKLLESIVIDHLADAGTIIISDIHPHHSYSVTSFEVSGFRVNLETFKHDITDLQVCPEIIEWSLKEFVFQDLLWKPGPHRFSTIRSDSGLPIFYVLIGRRKQA